MMGAGTASLKRPDSPRPQDYSNNKGIGAFFEKGYVDAVNEYEKKNPIVAIEKLESARKGYVKNTGGKLGDVRNAGIYKNFTKAQKKEYRKRNPQDFKEEEEKGFKLGKRSLLGK